MKMGVEDRRQREREKRRQQILEAARSLLFQKGIRGTSVNAIARRSELGMATIYFYFKNKEDIFAALQEAGLAVLYARILPLESAPLGPEEKLRKAAGAYLDFSRDHRDYFDVINYFVTTPDTVFTSGLLTRIHSRGTFILDLVAAIITRGIKTGQFKETPPGRYAIFFWASLHGVVLLQKMGKNTILENEAYDSFFNYAVDRLIDSICP